MTAVKNIADFFLDGMQRKAGCFFISTETLATEIVNPLIEVVDSLAVFRFFVFRSD